MAVSNESRVRKSEGGFGAREAQWVRTGFRDCPDLVAMLSPGGEVLAVNRDPPERHAGQSGGYSFGEFFGLDARADIQYGLKRAADTRRVVRMEVPASRIDGTRGWFLVTVTPVVEGEQCLALNVIGTDITERKREEDRLRRSEALMVDTHGVAHLGTWEWDITQPHAVWSMELYRIYGLDPKTHVPTYEDYLTRVHPDDRQRVIDATNEVFHNLKPYSHDERIFRADGSTRYLHTWAMPVLDEAGKLARLMGVCQDITDRKLAEMELAERAAELARSNAELEQFARIASHDLQEPLRTVGSFVQLLAQRYRGRLDAGADEAIAFAVEGVHRMKALIEDLLEYSRIAPRPVAGGHVELEAVLAQAEQALRGTIVQTGASVRHEPLPAVSGDEGQLVLLLQHLIANALRFSGPRAPRIEIGARALDGGRVEVHVRDHGIGIAPEHHARIFVVFQRLDADTPGTGVGLALCKKIVERHGGRIWVDSTPGAGATFRFTLPAAPAP